MGLLPPPPPHSQLMCWRTERHNSYSRVRLAVNLRKYEATVIRNLVTPTNLSAKPRSQNFDSKAYILATNPSSGRKGTTWTQCCFTTEFKWTLVFPTWQGDWLNSNILVINIEQTFYKCTFIQLDLDVTSWQKP